MFGRTIFARSDVKRYESTSLKFEFQEMWWNTAQQKGYKKNSPPPFLI